MLLKIEKRDNFGTAFLTLIFLTHLLTLNFLTRKQIQKSQIFKKIIVLKKCSVKIVQKIFC